MPGEDGIALLQQIRADERLARVPVLMLTAKGLTSDRVRGYKAGATGYLTKPFQPDELLAILDNAILRRRQMAANSLGERKYMSNIINDAYDVLLTRTCFPKLQFARKSPPSNK